MYPDGEESLWEAFCRILRDAAKVVQKLKDRPDKVVLEVSSHDANNELCYYEGTVEYGKKNFHEPRSRSTQIIWEDPSCQIHARWVRPSKEEEIALRFLKEAFPGLEFRWDFENNSLHYKIGDKWVKFEPEPYKRTDQDDTSTIPGFEEECMHYDMLIDSVNAVSRNLKVKGISAEIKRLVQFDQFVLLSEGAEAFKKLTGKTPSIDDYISS
jgi:hypothetical protein